MNRICTAGLLAAACQLVCADPTLAYWPQHSFAAAMLPRVWRSQDVINAIGVSTHIGYADPGSAYANLSNVINAAQWIGFTNFRDSLPLFQPGDPRLQTYDAVFSSGFKMSLVSPSDVVDFSGYPSLMAGMQANLHALQSKYPGQIIAMEGLNEPDISYDGYTFTYAGQSGPAAVAQHQIDLYNMVKSDSTIAGIPVWEFALNSPPYDQRMYEAVYSANGGVLSAFDVASRGVYGGVWSPEFLIKQQIVQPFDDAYDGTTFSEGPFQSSLVGRPLAVKETGLTAAPNGIPSLNISDYTVQAKLLPGTIFDTLALGSTHTFVYELADLYPDPSSSNIGDHFGFFDNNWSPKPSAGVMRNIFSHLADNAANATTFTPTDMTMTVSGFEVVAPGVVNSGYRLITQQANGTYQILIWYEPLLWDQVNNVELPAPGPVPITLNLSRTCGQTSVYDPYTNSTVSGPGNSSTIPVALPDHAVIATCQSPQ